MKHYFSAHTSAASSLLMVLNHFNESSALSFDEEARLSSRLSSNSVYNIALLAREHGLEPNVISTLPVPNFIKINLLDSGIGCELRNFSFIELESLIKENRVVILHSEKPNKFIVVHDFDGKFHVMDPTSGELHLNAATIDDYYDISEMIVF